MKEIRALVNQDNEVFGQIKMDASSSEDRWRDIATAYEGFSHFELVGFEEDEVSIDASLVPQNEGESKESWLMRVWLYILSLLGYDSSRSP